jgi:hypothetical protein
VRRLGLGGTRPTRSRRAVGLIDEIEEWTQFVHVAQPARAGAGRRDAIAAAHPTFDDPLLQRGRIAEPVRLALFSRQDPGGRRHLGGGAGCGRDGLLAPRHHERVPAGRALHGRTALGDAIVLEFVFGLTAIAANVHEPTQPAAKLPLQGESQHTMASMARQRERDRAQRLSGNSA